MQIASSLCQPLFCALCTVCHADLWLREVHNLLTPIWHIFPLLSHFIYNKNFKTSCVYVCND